VTTAAVLPLPSPSTPESGARAAVSHIFLPVTGETDEVEILRRIDQSCPDTAVARRPTVAGTEGKRLKDPGGSAHRIE